MDNTELHNKELTELYEKTAVEVLGKVAEYNEKEQDANYKTSCPLFLKSYDEYENADIKIMFFGQETNGWGCKGGIYGNEQSVEEIMKDYENFFISEYCYKHYKSHFWNGIRHIMNSLKEKSNGKQIGHLWNNAVKMGYNGEEKNFPKNFYDEIVKPHLNNLIVKEIEILKPDYIIFLTGPDYEFVLNDIFETPDRKSIEGFSNNELCGIAIPNVKKSFRTYHPRYLFSGKVNNIKDNVFKKIVEEIS